MAAGLELTRLRLSDMRRTVAAGGRGQRRRSDWRGLGRRVRERGAAHGAVLYGAARSDRRASAVGFTAGAIGAAGVGAGLAAAEVIARSRRRLALTVCGAAAGAMVGALAILLLRALLDTFLGLQLDARRRAPWKAWS